MQQTIGKEQARRGCAVGARRDAVHSALEAHRRGELAEAERICRELLVAMPDCFEVRHMLGTLLAQQGRHREAVTALRGALEIEPHSASALSNLGNALLALRRYAEALDAYDQALSIEPNLADALNNRGTALHAIGRHHDAVVSYDRALTIRPGFADTLANRGNALKALRRSEEALLSYERALALWPDRPDLHCRRAEVLQELGRPAEALAAYDLAIESRPDHAFALTNRGNLLQRLQRYEEALVSYDHSLIARPDLPETHNNRGAALQALNRHAEALISHDRAAALRPAYVEAHNNRASALQALGCFSEALSAYDDAIDVHSGYADAHVNRALLRLLLGDFALGWRGYEWRWKRDTLASDRRDYPQPLWLGEVPVAGRSILLHAEQGLGDTLQFARYAALLAERGALVHVEVQPSLKTLLTGLPSAASVFARGEPVPPFDLHCPLMSLPLAFGTELNTIPAAVPYVHAPADKAADWADLAGEGGPLVGLVWSGNPKHSNDRNRSMTLEALEPLLQLPGVRFVSLQKEPRPEDAQRLAQSQRVLDVSARLRDFADTAALVDRLDLVITVDTSVAHLAGAMGKPVWLLLPKVPDWRWLLEREDSPWYPTMRLFRQPMHGDWAAVVGKVRQALIGQFRLPAAAARAARAASGASEAGADRETRRDGSAQAAIERAVVFHAKGEFAQAEDIYRAVLASCPSHFDACHLLGSALAQQGKCAEALQMLLRALELNPDSATARSNLGNVLLAIGRHEEALACYDRALAARPDFADAHNNRGNVLQKLERFHDALASYDRALALRPGYAEAWNNRGNALKVLNRHDEALASYDRSLAIRPDYADAHSNRGTALKALGRYEGALASYDRALAIRPAHVDARFNRALLLLLRGEFAEGWAGHETRWEREVRAPDRRDYPQPLWLGKQAVKGRRILLHAEQGFGDTLQFARYASLLAMRGATVFLEVQRGLKALMTGLSGVQEVFERGEPVPPFDLHCPLMSLPLAFGTELNTIPAAVPYVHAPADKAADWADLAGEGGPLVGLVWSGNPKHSNDRNRSMTLEALEPLLQLPGVRFVSLQKEPRPEDARRLVQSQRILDVSVRLRDFADTAALVDRLDLVITVDTSVAHLAGAMGKPVWLLLPKVPDWRWLLEREDSPWYPTARLFRQQADGDWAAVVERVHAELQSLAAGRMADGVVADAHRGPARSPASL